MADKTQVERNRRYRANKAAKTAALITELEGKIAELESRLKKRTRRAPGKRGAQLDAWIAKQGKPLTHEQAVVSLAYAHLDLLEGIGE